MHLHLTPCLIVTHNTFLSKRDWDLYPKCHSLDNVWDTFKSLDIYTINSKSLFDIAVFLINIELNDEDSF